MVVKSKLRKLFFPITGFILIILVFWIIFYGLKNEFVSYLANKLNLIIFSTVIILSILSSIKFLEIKDKFFYHEHSIKKEIKNPHLAIGDNKNLYNEDTFIKFLNEILKILNDENYNQANILIEGTWGVGKSSLVNFIIKEINSKYKNKFDVILINLIGFYTSSNILKTLIRELSIKYKYPYWRDVLELYEETSFNNGFLNFNLILDNNLEFNIKLNDFKWWIYNSLKNKNKRLIIALDEMDRLLDKNSILNVMKFVNVFSRIPQVYLIATLDSRALLDIFEKEYLVKGYLYKTFDFVFKLKSPISIFNEYFYKEFIRSL